MQRARTKEQESGQRERERERETEREKEREREGGDGARGHGFEIHVFCSTPKPCPFRRKTLQAQLLTGATILEIVFFCKLKPFGLRLLVNMVICDCRTLFIFVY